MQTTWDLTLIFKDDLEFEKEYKYELENINELAEYNGKLADNLLEYLEKKDCKSVKLNKIYDYAQLKHDADTSCAKYQEMSSRVESLLSEFYQSISFESSQIIENEQKIRKLLETDNRLKPYEYYILETFKSKEHILDEDKEQLLANFGEIAHSPYEIFSCLNDTDLKFKDVCGKKLTHATFLSLVESKDREVRKQTYINYYDKYNEVLTTFASVLKANVKFNNLNAKIRKYKSARHASLFSNGINESVYDSLVDKINSNLYRFHEYMEYKKQKHGYEKFHMYDMYASTVSEVEFEFSIEEAKQIILEALKPLGEQYLEYVKQCFDEEWIDFDSRDGKRSGAYSGGSYDTRPYILMSWQSTLSSLYTLAHEIGHSIHSHYSRLNQIPINSNYTLFLAEIASNTNESFLTQYLIKKYKDDKKRLEYIIDNYLDGFKGSVFRQTQFAEFEQLIHKLDQDGEVLTKERLNSEYRKLNEKYYGPSVITDEYIEREWSRIPHFFYDFYVYQYATGFSCGIYFAKSVIEGGQQELTKYINFLKAGSSKNSIEILKDAGVDILSNEIFDKTFEEFSEKLELLKSL